MVFVEDLRGRGCDFEWLTGKNGERAGGIVRSSWVFFVSDGGGVIVR